MPATSRKTASDPVEETLSDIEEELDIIAKLGEAANINDLVLGLSPALAATNVYLSSAHSLGILYENAVAIQQRQANLAQGSMQAGLDQLRALTASGARAAEAAENPDQTIVDLLKALKTAV